MQQTISLAEQRLRNRLRQLSDKYIVYSSELDKKIEDYSDSYDIGRLRALEDVIKDLQNLLED